MRILIATTAALGFLVFTNVAQAEPAKLGPCVWAHIADADKNVLMTSYHQAETAGMQTHMAEFTHQLTQRDAVLQGAIVACDATPNLPQLWRDGLIAGLVMSHGASNELKMARGIDQAQLDATWRNAPQAARQCVSADAAKSYGINDKICPDAKAPQWFLTALGMNRKQASDHAAANAIIMYYYAYSQEEWAESLIANFEHRS